MYSEKATKFWEISTVDFSYVLPVKSMVEISQNFLAFSEYMNFNFGIKWISSQHKIGKWKIITKKKVKKILLPIKKYLQTLKLKAL